ncbi:Signal transduction histidine kinase [Pseudoalteromonas luteoviolacea B = ATCC 29581]|nr:Signal transduction histidine kinase [Pseudoalteromonas luteoviolacea B = ATCC 29581]
MLEAEMPNNVTSPLKGTLPLIFIIALFASIFSAAAGFLWPPTKSIASVNETLTNPDFNESLANVMMKLGFSQAKQQINALKQFVPENEYYLYSHNGMTDAVLIHSTSPETVNAISQDRSYSIGNRIHHHQLLKLDGQLVGELIIVETLESSSKGDSTLAYLFALLSLITIILGTKLVTSRASGTVTNATEEIEQELQSIVDQKDYTAQLDAHQFGHLGNFVTILNTLLQQVQSALAQSKAAEKELKHLQAGLETEVQSRTLALEKATLNAERANEAKTTFLATMSHEIRTPMNGVIGTIDLLRQTDLDGAQHRLTTIIRDSAFSLLGILDDILDFSKIEAGKLAIDNSAFSVSDTIEEVARVLSSVAKKRRLDLQLSIAPDIPNNLIGDSVRVRQVLYNLCSNAIKFTTTDDDKQGFVKISVEVSHNTSEHYTLRFTVTDNGKGMTQAQLREIFNPFIQAENSITREYGGTGLGLSICKSLIELMLGSIHVTSDIGMGSEFVVELPFSTQGKVDYANKSVLNGYQVVLFTLNPTRTSILSRYLSFMGATVNLIDNENEMDEFQTIDKVIWVLDAIDGMAEVTNPLRTLLYSIERFEQQIIVLSKMDEAAINHQKIFYLNASPLCKSSFMTSILVAAGLHTPKTIKQTASLNNYLSVDQARHENRLVLLAEDNILNQQVLTDQLHLLGYGVEVAENGEQGFEMWKKGQYPLILTDLHMPKMSGYDMVKKIRDEAEKALDKDAQPYIIAVTANALKGERDRCLAAGMNDYITKPIELNVLETTLNKWSDCFINPKTVRSETNKPTETIENKEIEPEPVDLETLNKYVNNDISKRERFFKMYLQQSSQLLSDINSGVMSSNQDVIIEACHQLKSISKTIGAMQVAQEAIQFEELCKGATLSGDELIKARDNLESLYSKASKFIEKTLKETEE